MRVFFLLCLLLTPVAMRAQSPDLPAGTRFIMSHFKANGGGGDERLYISVSPDGVQWTALNSGNPVYQPVAWEPFFNLVRDPSIVFANGFYWVAYTSGNYGRHASFGLVKSTDLVNWTFVGEIDTTLPGSNDPITWSPIFFKEANGEVHLFVLISPVGGANYHPAQGRIYELHPLNSDFTSWSAPVMVETPSPHCNEFYVWKEGATYHGIYVDYLSNGAYIHVTSTDLITGWSNAKNIGFNSMEGGFVLKRPSGGYRIYLEGGNGTAGYRFYDCDDAFSGFGAAQFASADVSMRNGKVVAAASTTTYADWQNTNLSASMPEDQVVSADPDNDGISNLLEYTSGLNPLVPEVSRRITTLGADLQTWKFRRMPSLADIVLQTEETGNFLDWNVHTPNLETRSITLQSDGSELVEALLPGSLERKVGLRLKSELLP